MRRLPMLTFTVNGEERTLPEPLTVGQMLERLGYPRGRVAVEVNGEVVPRVCHDAHGLAGDDRVEIVTLVGGGAPALPDVPADRPLAIGKFSFRSRLITGTGKYAGYDLMRDCLAA